MSLLYKFNVFSVLANVFSFDKIVVFYDNDYDIYRCICSLNVKIYLILHFNV